MSGNPHGRAWDARVLPWLVEKSCRSHAILDERRRWVPRAYGEVLELGVGSGLNLAFYDPTVARAVVAIDPSPELLARAAPRAAAAPVPVALHQAAAEALPFDAGRFDSALVTYTLCSVGDVPRALAEVQRVLRPGAPLIFVEHGRSDRASTAAWQRRITPLWRTLGGNCHLDRDIAALLTTSGFTLREAEAGHVPGGGRLTSFTYQGLAMNP